MTGSKTAAKLVRRKAKTSLADQAYEALKRLIITCELRPGEYVNESQLCETLGLGRTPVHQAISKLHQEEFVEVMPRKGIFVRPISLDEYYALDETRLILEPRAIRLAVERASDSEKAALRDLLEREKKTRAARDRLGLFMCDRDFHFLLARATHNPVLEKMLTSAYERSLRVWFMSTADRPVRETEDIHDRMVDAIMKRDADTASDLMREHILSSRALTLRTD